MYWDVACVEDCLIVSYNLVYVCYYVESHYKLVPDLLRFQGTAHECSKLISVKVLDMMFVFCLTNVKLLPPPQSYFWQWTICYIQ